MSDGVQGSGCQCCGSATVAGGNPGGQAAAGPATRARFVVGAEQVGIDGDDLTELVALFDRGDCTAVRQRMAQMVGERLAAAELQVVEQIEQAARAQNEVGGQLPGLSPAVAALQTEATDLTALVARLQAAGQRLTQPSGEGACSDDCPCVTAASAVATPRIPAARAALGGSTGNGSDLVCTIDGGIDAMRGRIGAWQAVLGRAAGREAADGGVSLTFAHDPAVTVELARLAAEEYACCSFFTFALTVGPAGMRFTVTAPPQAQEVVTAVFGSAVPAGARS